MAKLLSALLLIAVSLSAQEFRGTLTGTVSDATGAGVPNAKIIAVKTDTNTRSETVSGADGNYTLPFLAPGPYEVRAEAPGFKSYRHAGIQIGTNERVGEDIK